MTGDPNLPEDDALPDELAELLKGERSVPTPEAGAEARVLERLEQTLGLPPLGGGGGGGHGGGSAAATGDALAAAGAGVSKVAATVAVAVALGAGIAVGALGYASLGPRPAASVEVRTIVSVVRVSEPPGIAPTAPPSASALPAVSVESPAAQTAPVRPRGASSVVADPGARDRALAEENALIARAQAALARGKIAQAKAALLEHATRFPTGQLVTERKLLEAYTERTEKSPP